MFDGALLAGGSAAGAPQLAVVGAAVAINDIHADARLRLTLLKGLSAMAIRSKRRQADLAVVLRRCGLIEARESISAALTSLFDDGLIDDIVPLSDGGLLLSVTSLGIERVHGAPVSLAAA